MGTSTTLINPSQNSHHDELNDSMALPRIKHRLINQVIERNKKSLAGDPSNEYSTPNQEIINSPETEYFVNQFDINFLKDLIGPSKPKKYSCKTQLWKGIINEIFEDSFSAKLYDQNQNDTYEIGDFEIRDVSPEDMSYLKIGGVFYWSVGHFMENGQSLKKSEIRFQRLITLSEEDIFSAVDESSDLFNHLNEGVIE